MKTPVFEFSYEDKHLPKVLAHYLELLTNHGAPKEDVTDAQQALDEVVEWQAENKTSVPPVRLGEPQE